MSEPNSSSRHSFQFSLRTLFMAMTATALWMGCIVSLGSSPGLGDLGYLIVWLVLLGIATAIYYLLQHRQHSWLISAFVAPIVAMIAIVLVAALARLEWINT